MDQQELIDRATELELLLEEMDIDLDEFEKNEEVNLKDYKNLLHKRKETERELNNIYMQIED
jgi:hypothetical protein